MYQQMKCTHCFINKQYMKRLVGWLGFMAYQPSQVKFCFIYIYIYIYRMTPPKKIEPINFFYYFYKNKAK